MRKHLNVFLSFLTINFILGAASAQTPLATPLQRPNYEAPKVDWFKPLKVMSGVSISPSGELYFLGSDAKIRAD